MKHGSGRQQARAATGNWLAWSAFAFLCLSSGPCLSDLAGSANDDGLEISGDGVTCSVSSRGEISVTAGGLTYRLSGLQARRDKFAIVPVGKMLSSSIDRETPGRITGMAEFSFADGPRLALRIQIRTGVPGVLIESEMAHLGNDALNRDKWSWYHWAFAHAADRFISLVDGEPSPQPMSDGVTIPFSNWLFIERRDDSGGLGVQTRFRMSSDKQTAFIWSQARALDCVLAPAADVAAARAVFEAFGGVEAMRPVPTIEWAGQGAEYYGDPAPEWLHQAQVFNFLYATWADMTEWQDPKYFPLLLFSDRIAWPKDGSATDFIERSHKAGLRVIPYVCWSELANLALAGDRGYYNEIMDIQHHLDEWVCLDAKGEYVVSPWGRQTNQPHLYAMCMNAEGYREAVLASARNIMDAGADGLFIDNVASGFALGCNGDKLGRHKHVSPGASQGELYRDLMEAVYRLVKGYGEDNVVMHNGGLDWRTCDAQMTESFMYHFAGSAEPRVHTADELYATASLWDEARRFGKLAAPLCYTSRVAAEKRKDANYFTYATAKLAGALYSNWLNPKSGDPGDAGSLYQLRLGLPKGDIIRSGGVLLRAYDRGVVVVNAGEAVAEPELPAPAGKLRDVYSGDWLTVHDGKAKVALQPQSGRVYSCE